MTTEFTFRIIGMFVFAILGARFGVASSDAFNLPTDANGVIFSLVGALMGLIVTPWITTRPAKSVRHTFMESSIEVLVSGILGLLLGVFMGLLLAYPLSVLPDLLGRYLPITAALICGYFGYTLFSARAAEILGLTRRLSFGEDPLSMGLHNFNNGVLVDTSVIIDGRILEMSKTGFIPGTILIPQFVLAELQNIANSSDPQRRERGRHGLDILKRLKQDGANYVQVIEDDPENVAEVDHKLVEVAKARDVPLMTNDFNLNGIANVQEVQVLNVNELSLALQPVHLPGEVIYIKIISEGKESSQGVGYLKDGTMVVVEGGRQYLDRNIPIVITRYIRSTAGKMYFGEYAGDV